MKVSQKPGSRNFRQLVNSVMKKFDLLFNDAKCYLLHLIMKSCWLKSFWRTLTLMA